MLTLNFGGGPSHSASTFFKMASANGNFLHEDKFDAVIAIMGMIGNDNIMLEDP